jgi:hypothetical protein
MRTSLVGCILSLVCFAAACKDDSDVEPSANTQGSETVTGDSATSDGSTVDATAGDLAAEASGPDGQAGDASPDGQAGDGTGPGPDGLADGEQPDDGIGGDGTPDGTAPVEPYAPCSAQQKCPSKEQPLCLLLPDSDLGICVKPCDAQGAQCPPWAECVQPDSGNDTLHVCLEVRGLNQPCDATTGSICKDGLFCVAGLAGEGPMCTTFCTMGESVCQEGAACKPVATDEPDPDWGACLPKDDLVPCQSIAECPVEAACVEVTAGYFKCAPGCSQAGAPCGFSGSCVPLAQPDGNLGNVCLEFQEAGQICNPLKGLLCAEDLECADLAAADGWKRCLSSCADVLCSPGFVCKAAGVESKPLCVPLELAVPDALPCNDSYPCTEQATFCLKAAGQSDGLCVPKCEQGCPAGTTCQAGGCVTLSPMGSSCLESKAVLCESPAQCIRDKGAAGMGWCALPCVQGGAPCPGGFECIATPLGQSFCLSPVPYAHLCSLDEGLACDPGEGTTCIHISAESDFGFCTSECSGPGTCEFLAEDVVPECMIQKSGKWYCAFLCMGVGLCPDWMECSGLGFCMP